MTRLILLALAVTFPLRAASAQLLPVIRAGRLMDVSKGEVRQDQLVLVKGDRIEVVQQTSQER
jgi:hypothetical protein